MPLQETQRGRAVERLVDVMDRLLAPDGCPWDREQTLETLKPFLIEEAYEVLEAIDDTPAEHCDELGDLLFQIVFQSALRARAGAFGIDDVAQAIVDKLVRRHPHVFDDKHAKAKDSTEVLTQWAELKAQERAAKGLPERKPRTLDGVTRSLPALMRALQVQERAARVGFDWPDASGPRAKVDEELAELDAAPDAARAEAELGDLLFAVVNLARKRGLDAEQALRGATARFQRRFEWIEDRLGEQGRTPAASNLDEMDALWNAAKRALAASVT